MDEIEYALKTLVLVLLTTDESFIGFNGTPIEKTDASKRTVFGDYI